MDEHDGIAAIIVEPLQRIVPARPGFLEGLRALCDKHGVLLIFDEIVTGFRLAYGGAQQRYGVVPDICTLGKVIGGGFPLAAAAGLKTMDVLRRAGTCERLIGLGERLMKLQTAALTQAGVAHRIVGAPTLFVSVQRRRLPRLPQRETSRPQAKRVLQRRTAPKHCVQIARKTLPVARPDRG